jgi:hypothetical protein
MVGKKRQNVPLHTRKSNSHITDSKNISHENTSSCLIKITDSDHSKLAKTKRRFLATNIDLTILYSQVATTF